MGNISTNDIQSLIQLFEKSDWREMHLILGETDLFLSKDRNAQTQISLTTAAPSVPALSHRASVPATPVETPDPKPHGSKIPAGWTLVKAPSLGTFYRAPKPGAPMFTEIGAQVAADFGALPHRGDEAVHDAEGGNARHHPRDLREGR